MVEPLIDIRTSAEDFGIMFAPFCPVHAHVCHQGECNKWQKLIKARRMMRANLEAGVAKKADERARKYAAAASSSHSGARF